MPERIQIRCQFALGDVVVLTAAVRDLCRSFPGKFEISIDSGVPDVWIHNPYVRERIFPGKVIDCADAQIDHAGKTGRHYVHTYLDLLNERLGTDARISEVKGDIHLSDIELSWYSDLWNLCGKEIPFWIVCSGGKFDLPIKWWDHQRYQQVVNALRGRIQFVQVGFWGNHHPALEGAIDLRGKTTVRDLIHLVHHADGVLCGVTSLMHLAAAVPTRGQDRAAIIVAGNREPKKWEAYPGHTYLTAGSPIECGNCWNTAILSSSPTDAKTCRNVSNDLPRCMDLISAERVIESFFDLARAGRIGFNSKSQTPFAAKALRVAARRNRFDLHNITPRNSADRAEEFLRAIPPYPKDRFAGRGVVICAGGLGYFTRAWVCIRMLRQFGCTLPIELWFLGPEEIDDKMERLLSSINVECVNARDYMKSAPMRNPLGWELKCYSVLHSHFREILSLDADNVPIVDPTFLFDTPQYQDTGAIFWPDYGQLSPRREIWSLCGVPFRREPEFESGQMVINKEACWRALNLAWWYNDHSEFFYRYIHGDKDTFHFAWRRAGAPYSMPPYPIQSLEGVMCQHDFRGRRIFQHRNSHKWSFFGENKRIQGFQFEEDCRKHLEDLRHQWNGHINNSHEFRTWRSVYVRSQTVDQEVLESVALHDEYRLPHGLQPRDVVVDVGAHIGSFVRACFERGSRAVHAFEPHPENFELLKRNTHAFPGIHLYHSAVLDESGRVSYGDFPSAPGQQNTGGSIVIRNGGPVECIGINKLLARLNYVSLLKLDCEGSEWPILFHLEDWHRVGSICGEYHLSPSASLAKLNDLLKRNYRYVSIQRPSNDGLGKFWGSHIKNFFRDAHPRRQTNR